MVLFRMFYLRLSCWRSPLPWNLGNLRHNIILFFVPYKKKKKKNSLKFALDASHYLHYSLTHAHMALGCQANPRRCPTDPYVANSVTCVSPKLLPAPGGENTSTENHPSMAGASLLGWAGPRRFPKVCWQCRFSPLQAIKSSACWMSSKLVKGCWSIPFPQGHVLSRPFPLRPLEALLSSQWSGNLGSITSNKHTEILQLIFVHGHTKHTGPNYIKSFINKMFKILSWI